MNASALSARSGDELLRMLAALANPHRLRIVAALTGERNYVSELARQLGMSRPLLHLHLQRLEGAGLIAGALELSDDGKAMKYYTIVPFSVVLTPEWIADLAQSISDASDDESTARQGRQDRRGNQ